jgi:pSer/pThr/pTyr-binding forkhead associated (FHA) protein
VPVAVVFLLRAVVLILLWGFVVATVIAVRHDVFGTKSAKPAAPLITPPSPQPAGAGPAAASRQPAPPKASRRRRSATATKVAVIDGPAAGTSVALSSLPVTIGRANNSSIVLGDDVVSNQHARLVPRGEDWLIEDLGSTNGTFLGDKKVTAPVVVPVGGRIKIGRSVLELQ